MGNCIKSSEYHNTKRKPTAKIEKTTLDLVADTNVDVPGNVPIDEGGGVKYFGDCNGKVDLKKNSMLPAQTSASNAAAPLNKGDPSWLRFLNQSKTQKDRNMDMEDCSIFGENWELELFDQRNHVSSYPEHSDPNHDAKDTGDSLPGNWTNWACTEKLELKSRSKKHEVSTISSSILGFSCYPTKLHDTPEWFRNGELESPQPEVSDYLIKGKQRTNIGDEKENDYNAIADKLGEQDTSLSHEGWLRYTMFLIQDKGDIHTFYSKLRNEKHVFLSLEAKTGCELRISKRLFIHRGKLVRVFAIDGPSRKHIIRCYTSLPAMMTKLIISDCERPSMVEPRPIIAPNQELGLPMPTIFQRPIAV